MIENIIFDVDGTLWDSCAAVAKAWNEVYKRRGLVRRFSEQDVSGCMGLTLPEISEQFFPDTPEALRREILRDCMETENRLLAKEGGKIYEGVKETLVKLSAVYGVYIVSNCERGYIEALLAFSGLGAYVDGFLCAGATGKEKGENLKILIAEYKLKNCAYVGDTRKDEIACKEAGIPFVWAAYGFGCADSPDAIIHSFAELEKTVRSL